MPHAMGKPVFQKPMFFFSPFIAECGFFHYNQHQGLSTCQEKHPKSLGNKHIFMQMPQKIHYFDE